MKFTLETLIVPTLARCLCGVYLASAQERKDGLCGPCADAPAVFDVHPTIIVEWAMKKGRELEAQEAEDPAVTAGIQSALELLGVAPAASVLSCGCYSDACYCGQYPTDAEWMAMQAEADALLPIPEPMTDAEMIEAEELRNFFGRRQDA
jgi:hypothetical protein